MTRAGGAITLLVGVVLLRLTVTGTYERYVRVEMGLWLALAGCALVALGLVTLVRPLDHAHDHQEHHGHRHGDGIGAGWLLLAPLAALLLVAPPTLGSYGVDRSATIDVTAGSAVFDPLLPSGRPVPMSLLEFAQRAFEQNGASFRGVPVELTGFVAGAESGGFRLARYQIACCAADAAPVVARVVGTAGDAPERDQWVRVTGTVRPGATELPELASTSIVVIPAPEDPYE